MFGKAGFEGAAEVFDKVTDVTVNVRVSEQIKDMWNGKRRT
jgi:hypothetical protein